MLSDIKDWIEDHTVNWPLLGTTVGCAVIAWVLSRILYDRFIDSLPRVVLIGIVFLVLFVIEALGVFLVSIITDSYCDDIIDSRLINLLVVFAGGALGALLLGMLLQFLYGMNQETVAKTTTDTYIFMIDNSGSMEDNDPDMRRYSAITEIMKDMPADSKYAVYGFGESIEELVPLHTVQESVESTQTPAYGGTPIRGMLEYGIQEYTDGHWGADTHPRVILLTDGYATDIGLFNPINKVIREYAKNGIRISTVGLGYVDEALLTSIADGTGGVYIGVDNISDLIPALTEARVALSQANRDLLNYRPYCENNALYAVLRVIFLLLLGCGLAVILLLAYQDSTVLLPFLIQRGVMSLIGSILTEVLVQNSGKMGPAWLLLWLLFSVVVLVKEKPKQIEYAGMYSANINF